VGRQLQADPPLRTPRWDEMKKIEGVKTKGTGKNAVAQKARSRPGVHGRSGSCLGVSQNKHGHGTRPCAEMKGSSGAIGEKKEIET